VINSTHICGSSSQRYHGRTLRHYSEFHVIDARYISDCS